MLTPLTPADRRVVGHYRLRGRLGSGGMGTVYLGVGADDQPVAVKVIRSDLLDSPEFRARFRVEAAAAARVRGGCVARVLDADPDADEPWMATEYVEGVNLMTAVNRGGRLDGANLLTLAVGLAEGLVAVHAVNVVHRDLKPSNILLSWEGPKIIDFGLARAEDLTSNTSTGNVIGTVAWMAPERLNGESATRAADVFAWGMCVAYAARGRHPFEAQTAAATAMRILSTEPALDGVPDALLPTVAAALRRDPAARPDAVELVERLTGQRIASPLDVGLATSRLLADWVPPSPEPAIGGSVGSGGAGGSGGSARGAGQDGPSSLGGESGPAREGALAGGAAFADGAALAGETGSAGGTGSIGSATGSGELAGVDDSLAGRGPAAAPSTPGAGAARVPGSAGRPSRRRRRLLRLALVIVILLAATAMARPLFDGARGESGNPPGTVFSSGPLTAGPDGTAGTASAASVLAAAAAGAGAGAGASSGPSAGPGPSDGAVPPGATLSPSDAATAAQVLPTATGRPIDAAPPARTIVVSADDAPVTTYFGPTTLGLFGGARGTVPSGTPVQVYCGVYAQQVTVGNSTTRLWVYTSPGWVPAGYVESGSSAPGDAPSCLGTVSNPKLGSGPPRPDTGPFPLTQTVSVLQLAGGVVGMLTNALLAVDPVGQLVGGTFVVLRCQQADGNNTVWDQLVSGGWIQNSYVYSGTSGSPAPAC